MARVVPGGAEDEKFGGFNILGFVSGLPKFLKHRQSIGQGFARARPVTSQHISSLEHIIESLLLDGKYIIESVCS